MGLPVKGVSSGSGWLASRGTSVKEGRKRVSFGLCVFSGSFGVRSIVLCKCSGKYRILPCKGREFKTSFCCQNSWFALYTGDTFGLKNI